MSEVTKKEEEFLECERPWVFAVLTGVGGFFGAFTYSVRGGVFSNAQTANFVLFAMALGQMQWQKALYYLIPMSAYLLGAVISESIAGPIRHQQKLRWDTWFILLEMIAVVFLGLLPESAPYQITQITVNFICSMQYNTFRRAQNIPMATTFCTNHVRQVGVAFSKFCRHREKTAWNRMMFHLGMLGVFVLGGVAATILCRFFQGKAMFALLIPLGIIFIDFVHADIKARKEEWNKVPRGH